jgi:hypothetical protein
MPVDLRFSIFCVDLFRAAAVLFTKSEMRLAKSTFCVSQFSMMGFTDEATIFMASRLVSFSFVWP